ncbi:MAG: YicC/YloC family endoribonuclease, partial [candidate division NC10 bacterium]
MLKSMTGYGRAEGATAPYLYTVEIQAFNHRFTDIRIRLPRALASLEHGLHREIRERVHRGRFDVQV